VTVEAREEGREVGGMSRRTAAWLAWLLLFLCVALVALTGLLGYLTPPIPKWEMPTVLAVLYGMLSLTYPTVGALIASRRPKNTVGWIFCFFGLLLIVSSFVTAYTNFSLFASPAPLPATQYMAWLADSDFELAGIAMVSALLLLLYPDGRLLARGWGIAAWGVVIGCPLWVLEWATWPGPLYAYRSIDNPFGISGGAQDAVEALGAFGILLTALCWVAAAISWVDRWGRADGQERQQLKWFAYSCFLIVVSLVYPPYLTPPALALLPIAAGIAILRYRLYDIDVVINRTLVYGALTAALVAVYFGGIVLLQGVGSVVLQVPFRALTGQESQLATVAATLAIAALFNPLRRRIQAFIDRRFYRRKYDAAKTLETFSAKLREETDLDALSDDLVGVVRETMQPAHVSLWLRPDTVSKGKQPD
jgi:hypothetical protein